MKKEKKAVEPEEIQDDEKTFYCVVTAFIGFMMVFSMFCMFMGW